MLEHLPPSNDESKMMMTNEEMHKTGALRGEKSGLIGDWSAHNNADENDRRV